LPTASCRGGGHGRPQGKIVYSDAIGFQDKGANTPMKLDSIFRIYSMTKPLASVAAMMLVEDGVIQLTDPVSKFLPAFKDMQVSVATTGADGKTTYANVPLPSRSSCRDLLRHSSGLGLCGDHQERAGEGGLRRGQVLPAGVHEYDSRGMTPAEQVARIAKAPLIHQPGTTWEYSMAVDILGRVVEAASGKRLAVVLDERLFKPLKMVGPRVFGWRRKRCRAWHNRCRSIRPRARRSACSTCRRSR
jgi:CubicO group peptidase (beta-lactamase class C family)